MLNGQPYLNSPELTFIATLAEFSHAYEGQAKPSLNQLR